MDTNQTTTTTITSLPLTPPAYSTPPRGMFGSKIPSSAAYLVGILLFLMPFIDIKCNGVSLQQVNGVQLATGFKMKNNSSDNAFLNDIKTDKVDSGITKATTGSTKKDPNLYALIALCLGGLGLILSLTNSKASMGMGIVAGICAAGALVGMMLDVKKKVKLDMPDLSSQTPDNDVGNTIDKIGGKMNDLASNVKITVDFTPWFYIAVLAFLAAAFFCYRRMAARK